MLPTSVARSEIRVVKDVRSDALNSRRMAKMTSLPARVLPPHESRLPLALPHRAVLLLRLVQPVLVSGVSQVTPVVYGRINARGSSSSIMINRSTTKHLLQADGLGRVVVIVEVREEVVEAGLEDLGCGEAKEHRLSFCGNYCRRCARCGMDLEWK